MTTMTENPPTTSRPLTFVEPLPGFDGEDAFTLSAIDPHGVLFSMRSARDPELRFVLTPAGCFFEDYQPELAAVIGESLGTRDATDVELLLMLTITSGLPDATANLRAPIVVAPSSGRAMQVVLDDESLPMHRRLVP